MPQVGPYNAINQYCLSREIVDLPEYVEGIVRVVDNPASGALVA